MAVFGWIGYQIKVTKEDQTITAVFDEEIPTWPFNWYSGKFCQQ